MRRSMATLVALAAVSAGIAGCSSKVDGTGSFGAAGGGQPLSSKSAQEILSAAGAVANTATAVHVTGVNYVGDTKYDVDLQVGGDKTCKGTVAINNEDPTTLVILDGHLYYSVDKGKSFKRGSDDADASKQAISTCSQDSLRAMVKPGSAVTKKGTSTVEGQKAVTIVNSGTEVTIKDDSGSPFVLEFSTPKEKHKTDLHFSDWNKPVSVEKPANIKK